jgi:penicillin amidase
MKILFLTASLLVGFLNLARASSEPTCRIHIDSNGLVFIKVSESENEAVCMGYAHGRYRAVQMDHLRRVALGQTAEIYGFSHLKADLSMKLLNFPRWAQPILDTMSEKGRKFLEDYSRGVNRGLKESNQQPVGELASGYPKISDWTPLDSIIILLLQSFDQTRKTFSTEIENSKAIQKWGAEQAKVLNQIEKSPWETTILKKDELSFLKNTISEGSKSAPQSIVAGNFEQIEWPEVFGEEGGSNSWILQPKLTKEKVAILANDPHLDLKTPIFWLWLNIETPEHNTIGATLPGVPVVAAGTNQFVSWGVTNSYYNSADGILISKDLDLISINPMVWVKWYSFKIPFFFKKFERTPEGFPILPIEVPGVDRKIALVWSGFFLKGSDIEPMFTMSHSQSVSVIDSNMAKIGLPSWNFVYADVKGNIGFRTIGKLTKNTTDVFGFREQKEPLNQALDFLSPEQNPQAMNPKRGWLVTANNKHYPANSSLSGGMSYTQGFRAYRVEELLAKNKVHTLEGLQQIQCDILAVDAKFFVPHILKVLMAPEFVELSQKLSQWDYLANEDCQVCGIYRLGMMKAMESLQVTETGLFGLANNNAPEWRAAIETSFRQALSEVGFNAWGLMHKNKFSHVSQQEKWNYSPEISTPGDKHTVNPGTSYWDGPEKKFWHTNGASLRMIVKMTKTPEVYLTLPGMNVEYHSKNPNKVKTYPWRDWVQCRQQKVQWPVNWSKVESDSIQF